jgi:hypothetical protein
MYGTTHAAPTLSCNGQRERSVRICTVPRYVSFSPNPALPGRSSPRWAGRGRVGGVACTHAVDPTRPHMRTTLHVCTLNTPLCEVSTMLQRFCRFGASVWRPPPRAGRRGRPAAAGTHSAAARILHSFRRFTFRFRLPDAVKTRPKGPLTWLGTIVRAFKRFRRVPSPWPTRCPFRS